MTIINGIEMDDGVDDPDDRHAATLDEQGDPPRPPSDAKPGDVWGAYRFDSDGWWRLADAVVKQEPILIPR